MKFMVVNGFYVVKERMNVGVKMNDRRREMMNDESV